MIPLTEAKRLQDALRLTWADGFTQELSNELLRTSCPCAECREARGDSSHAKPLSPVKKSSLRVISATKDEALNLRTIAAVGNYALRVEWADGHQTGIYTFDFLRELAQQAATRRSSENANG